MTELLRRVTREQLPGFDVEGASKTELLSRLEHHRGPAAVVRAGYTFRELPPHPVLQALLDSVSPRELLERWMRLERFWHTRHRTRLVAADERSLVVRHVSLAGNPIPQVDDLFIWGVLVALLERAGVTSVSATLEGAGTVLFERGCVQTPLTLPRNTELARFRWEGHDARTAEPSTFVATERTVAFVLDTLRADLLRTTKLDEVAKRRGVSIRALQRALRDEGTTFSDLVHRARIERALQLLDDRRLSLTEVAFCVGFSDEAHFSRTFRRFMDVPPTGYRELGKARTARATRSPVSRER
jgi:AraC-like DNA-binding protein